MWLFLIVLFFFQYATCKGLMPDGIEVFPSIEEVLSGDVQVSTYKLLRPR